MIPANDILARRNEIKDCIAAADMERAVKRLIDFVREFQAGMEDEVIILSMDYYELSKEERLDIIPYETAKQSKRKIAHRILLTLNSTLSKLELHDGAFA
ncbi:MAG: hypothetical protein IPJ74_24205 [Saprospiraceae bacterium]|nr:hypothetical protein [Saprospiraceae bacterium]